MNLKTKLAELNTWAYGNNDLFYQARELAQKQQALIEVLVAGLKYPVDVMQGDLETHLGVNCGKAMRKGLQKAKNAGYL
jgi:hypothetical protein